MNNNAIRKMYFDRSTNRFVLPADPLPFIPFRSEAAENNSNVMHSSEQGIFSSSLTGTSSLPELTSNNSPTYFDDSDYSPYFDDQVEFESIYSPVVPIPSQQNQFAKATEMIQCYEQLLKRYEQVESELGRERQVAWLNEWSGANSQAYPSQNNGANAYQLPPAAPFNGDPTLLIIDKSKVAELNSSTTPITSPRSVFEISDDEEHRDNVEWHECESQQSTAASEESAESSDESSDEDDDNVESWYDCEEEQVGSGGVVGSESEQEVQVSGAAESTDLFPPLPDRGDQYYEQVMDKYPVIKSAFGESDSPLSMHANDSDMGDDVEELEQVEVQPGYADKGHEVGQVKQEEQETTDSDNDVEMADGFYASVERNNKRKVSQLDDDDGEDESDGDDYQPGPSTKRKRVSSKPVEKKKKKQTKKAATKRRVSGGDDKPFKCPHCEHASKRRYNLTTHLKTHDINRVRDFPCPHCEKAFDRKHDKDRHIATVHQGTRAYKCNKCNAQFSRGDALARHLEKHIADGDA